LGSLKTDGRRNNKNREVVGSGGMAREDLRGNRKTRARPTDGEICVLCERFKNLTLFFSRPYSFLGIDRGFPKVGIQGYSFSVVTFFRLFPRKRLPLTIQNRFASWVGGNGVFVFIDGFRFRISERSGGDRDASIFEL
jgi:hypothetical protein